MSWYTGGEKFVVTSSRPAGDDTMVASEIVYTTNDPPLKIEWRVRGNDGKPTIIDVLPEGVSLVLTHRSEFDEVVAQGRHGRPARRAARPRGRQGQGRLSRFCRRVDDRPAAAAAAHVAAAAMPADREAAVHASGDQPVLAEARREWQRCAVQPISRALACQTASWWCRRPTSAWAISCSSVSSISASSAVAAKPAARVICLREMAGAAAPLGAVEGEAPCTEPMPRQQSPRPRGDPTQTVAAALHLDGQSAGRNPERACLRRGDRDRGPRRPDDRARHPLATIGEAHRIARPEPAGPIGRAPPSPRIVATARTLQATAETKRG